MSEEVENQNNLPITKYVFHQHGNIDTRQSAPTANFLTTNISWTDFAFFSILVA